MTRGGRPKAGRERKEELGGRFISPCCPSNDETGSWGITLICKTKI